MRTILKKGMNRRIWTSVLAVCMVLTISPFATAVQASVTDGNDILLSGFASLPEEVLRQNVSLGTSSAELTLPNMLEAMMSSDKEDVPPGESSESETQLNTKSVTVHGVTWDSEPIYDGDIMGTYIFTAVLPDGYAMEDGVSLPEITVTVGKLPKASRQSGVATVNGNIYQSLAEAINAAQSAPSGSPEEAYTVTLLSDVEADMWGESVTGKVILDTAGFTITCSSMYNPDVITVFSAGNLTIKGSGGISGYSNAIVNKGIVTVKDTVKLSSSVSYGLSNAKTANLYGGEITGYKFTSDAATVNMKDGSIAYKAVKAADESDISIAGGKLTINDTFKIIPDTVVEPVYEAKIGDTSYASIGDAFNSLVTTPGTEDAPIVIEVLMDCESKFGGLKVPQGAHAILQSTGSVCTVKRAADNTDAPLITVKGNLELNNIILDGGAAVDANGVNSGITSTVPVMILNYNFDEPQPFVVLKDGAVVQNNYCTQNAGGIHVYSGKLTVNGGSILNNTAAGKGGGGVFVGDTVPNSAATSEMELLRGEISGNSASLGGGIQVVENAAFTMSGGVIKNNTATNTTGYALGGGGVSADGLFIMSGGEITGNRVNGSAEQDCGGGGVWITEYGDFRLSGSPVIKDNTQSGLPDNIGIYNNAPKITETLDENAYLGVSCIGTYGYPAPGAAKGIILANAGYSITEGDLKRFHQDERTDTHKLRLHENAVQIFQPIHVTYEANGGSGSVPSDIAEYMKDNLVTVKFDTLPKRAGYFFLGWAASSSATVPDYTADGTASFTANNVQVTLYAVWKQDSVAPAAEISINENKWNQFWNTMTFGLFFKETKTICFTAVDNDGGSGLDKIYYYLSDTALTETDVKALPDNKWTEGASKNIAPNFKGFIYAKAADIAGNIGYASIDGGLVAYSDATLSKAEKEFNKDLPADVTIPMNLNGNTLKEIKNGSSILVKETDYTVSDDTVTIKKEYFSSALTGTELNLTFEFNPMGVETTEVRLTAAFKVTKHTHTPAADDGDCTTAIRCSTCQFVTTEAKTHVLSDWQSDGDNYWKECTNKDCDYVEQTTVHNPNGDSPLTGENSNANGWFAALLISGFGILILLWFAPRKKRYGEH